MIIAFQGWLQSAPRLRLLGKEAARFYVPLATTLPVPLRARVDPADKLAEDKASNACLKPCIPLPCCSPKAQRQRAQQLLQSHCKAPPSPVLVTNRDSPRAAHATASQRYELCVTQEDLRIQTQMQYMLFHLLSYSGFICLLYEREAEYQKR